MGGGLFPRGAPYQKAQISDRGLAGYFAITFGQQRAYRRQLEKLERWPVSRAAPKDLREKLAGSPSAYVVH
ncbi:MAG: hypothetical protein Q7R32_05185, partial [Dehalococcoidia bacterium]|nr:hypothetical protein [Dehalococcoidia bacterium]MDP2675793.1 hypothetical protein [Dehalococcoidia bacterium]